MVLVAEVDGSIDGVLASYVRDSIEDAEAIRRDARPADRQRGNPRRRPGRARRADPRGERPGRSSGSGRRRPRPRAPGSCSCTRPRSPPSPRGPAWVRSSRSICRGRRAAGPRRSRTSRAAGSRERGRPTPVGFPDEPIPAQAALDRTSPQVAAASITGSPAQARRTDGRDRRGRGHAPDAGRDGSERRAGDGPFHGAGARRPNAARGGIADLDLRPARPRARRPRLRAHAAGLRVRGVRRGGHARARDLRADGRAVLGRSASRCSSSGWA